MFLRHNALGLGWAIFILVLSGIPGNQFGQSQHEHLDKVVHILLYAVLYLLLLVGFIKQQHFHWLRVWPKLKTALIAIGYGVIIEYLQGLIFIDRSIELYDMIANSIGVGIGLGLFYLIYGKETYA